ncbi:MAG: CehA/McbA family metallohydrolase, partial [Candidatus Eisenbacteria sp.]|nr:CehA/McbA family metallohydrolase [Candidatus Eisenbacteria bacterium]
MPKALSSRLLVRVFTRTMPWVFLFLSIRPPPAGAVRVEVHVVDTLGVPIPARMHVRDSMCNPYPGYPDSTLMSHGALGSYFYMPGTVEMDLPAGVTDITVGRGFEWRPIHLTPNIQSDTILVVTLDHVFDMRSQGWYGGDSHVHTRHEPIDYPVGPEQIHLVALCEDLAQVWCLDQHYEFTGSPHQVSTPEANIYYSTEYRNQAYGHVGLLGLKEMIGVWCCGPGWAAYPMLCDLHEEWNPGWGESMSLAHPQTGADFFADQGWPECGLGRELPVLAALEHLDQLDITAYTNEPDVYVDDWYRLLNCGLMVPPSAGTDAVTNQYWTKPAGGYRVYVKEEFEEQHDHDLWVEGLKAGHCFVTNYPLIPDFAVNSVEAGGILDLPGPRAQLDVSFRIASVLPLEYARILCNGVPAACITLPGINEGTVLDTTVQVTLDESSWLALCVDGNSDLRHPVSSELLAHTGAVYVRLGGEPIRVVGDAGYFLDWIDSLEIFVELRNNWGSEEEHQHVLQMLDDARGVFGALFLIPPGSFELLTPLDGDSLQAGGTVFFDWTDAQDPEQGDRVSYRVHVSADSLFRDPWISPPGFASHLRVEGIPLPPDQTYWWRVVAEDRGGNTTVSTPDKRLFYLVSQTPASVWENPGEDEASAEDEIPCDENEIQWAG